MDNNSRRRNSPEDYIFGRVIGEGSFSTVYLAKEIESGREYASKLRQICCWIKISTIFCFPVKVCDKEHIIREKKQDYVKREKSALHLLNNSAGVISLACTFQDRRNLYFVLTFAANGELLKYIRSQSISLDCARFYSGKSALLKSWVLKNW